MGSAKAIANGKYEVRVALTDLSSAGGDCETSEDSAAVVTNDVNNCSVEAM